MMITLEPRGAGRFFTAGFLLFWLCGWAIGEGFALWILGNGAAALMTGTPLKGPALAMGAFLLLWLSFWTLGGIAAVAAFLQMVWAEDRLTTEGGGLVLQRQRGPFLRRREFPRDTVRRILISPRNGALALETGQATVELSPLGTPEERAAAASALRSELGIPDVALVRLDDALPKGWEEVITPEGARAVAPDRGTRRTQARVAAALTVGAGALAAALIRESLDKVQLLPFAILFSLGTVALAAGCIWLARGRMEWRIGSGSLTLRRRFGSGVKDVFEARRFELTTTPGSSDSHEYTTLEAVSTVEASEPFTIPALSRIRAKNRRQVVSVTGDPMIPRRLGAYLARAGNVPFVDRTTPEARQADLAAIQEQLEKSGPLGRFAVRLALESQKKKRM
jgi:hypothetical protein